MYFEKATNICEISTVDLSYVVTVKSMVEILQIFVAFLEYMNFNSVLLRIYEHYQADSWTSLHKRFAWDTDFH